MSEVVIIALSVGLPVGVALMLAIALGMAAADDDASREAARRTLPDRRVSADVAPEAAVRKLSAVHVHAARRRRSGARKAA